MSREIADIERELCEAIDTAFARGDKLVRYSRGDCNGICALHAWSKYQYGSSSYLELTDCKFGWTCDQVVDFTDGWDGLEGGGVLHSLGARLAAKYIDNAKGGAQ